MGSRWVAHKQQMGATIELETKKQDEVSMQIIFQKFQEIMDFFYKKNYFILFQI